MRAIIPFACLRRRCRSFWGLRRHSLPACNVASAGISPSLGAGCRADRSGNGSDGLRVRLGLSKIFLLGGCGCDSGGGSDRVVMLLPFSLVACGGADRGTRGGCCRSVVVLFPFSLVAIWTVSQRSADGETRLRLEIKLESQTGASFRGLTL